MCLVNETVHYTTDCSFLSLPLQQEIAMVISSPFLRCLQTAQQACNALELPGVHTFNGLCEIVAPECNMRGAPEVPAMADVEACGITLINVDSSPFAGYPEKVTDAIARCVSQEQRIGLVEQSWLCGTTHWPLQHFPMCCNTSQPDYSPYLDLGTPPSGV